MSYHMVAKSMWVSFHKLFHHSLQELWPITPAWTAVTESSLQVASVILLALF